MTLSRPARRTWGRRAARALLAMAGFGVPVVLLAFAVRQESDAVVAFDQEAIGTATAFARNHGLVPLLVVLQEMTQPVVVYAAATVVVALVARATQARGGRCGRS